MALGTELRKKAIRGWCMYDWANSAFATSIGTAIMPVYFVALFQDAFGSEASILGFTVTGSSTWSLGVALSTMVVAFSSPILGVIADRTRIKKTLLWIYTSAGAGFTVLAFFSAYSGAEWAWALGCYMLANIGFAGSIVFYNSFLPHLAESDDLDRVSSKGFAYGYVGGGLLLAIHLVVILIFSDTDSIDLVTRLAIGSVGFWWFGWAIWTFKTVPEPEITNPVTGLNLKSASTLAFSGLRQTFRELVKFKMLGIFLIAYLLFNDGIQTVLAVAGAFGPDTLGISLVSNMATILIVQFVAALGAMIFSNLAKAIGTKRSLVVSLLGWCVVIALAIGFAPLIPSEYDDFDYKLKYSANSNYEVVEEPEISEDDKDTSMWLTKHGYLLGQNYMNSGRVEKLLDAVGNDDDSRYSIFIKGGTLDKTFAFGPSHPSVISGGPVDWWPRTLRSYLWEPLGLSVDLQWLFLGVVVGLVLGGSQALARSLFAYMTPESRSTEFFGFFGLIGRASAVFGPMLYLIFTGIYDTRVAILVLLVIIVVGTILLKWVNVNDGRLVAESEDRSAKP